ncbi:MAG: hypothetical protein ACOCQD_03505 [archaeon]
MDTLFDLMQEILRTDEHHYYSRSNIKSSFNLEDLLSREENAKNYISEYFSLGQKKKLFEEEIQRPFHVLSVYLLGIVLYKITNHDEHVKKEIDEIVKKINDSGYYSFEYFWYLTALFHDQAYYYENNISREFQYNIFGLNNLFQKSTYNPGKKHVYVNQHPRYDKNLYLKYMEFKIQEFGSSVDHGIYGASILFERARHNLITKFLESEGSISNLPLNEFYFKNLQWSANHLDIFRKISFTILDHNVWRQDDIDLVNKYDLNELYNDNYIKVNDEAHPLLFLLCLVDTIDPIKYIDQPGKHHNQSIYGILNNISIEYEQGSLLRIVFNKSYFLNLQSFNVKKLKKAIKSLEQFMDLTVTVEEDSKNDIFLLMWGYWYKYLL